MIISPLNTPSSPYLGDELRLLGYQRQGRQEPAVVQVALLHVVPARAVGDQDRVQADLLGRERESRETRQASRFAAVVAFFYTN